MATTKAQFAAWRAKHRERLKLQAREYRKQNAEKIRARRKQRRAENFDKIRAQERAGYARNLASKRAADKRYRDAVKADPIRWARKLKTIADGARNRRHANPHLQIAGDLRARIWGALHRGRGEKSKSTQDLIGCTFPFLRKWIEAKFKRGMSWENYGEWVVDHVIPVAKFDLTNPAHQSRCFHYTNLQPLWKIENLIKHDKITPTQPELLISIQ